MRLTDRIRRILAGVGAALLFIKGWLAAGNVYVGHSGWALAYLKGVCLWAVAFSIVSTLNAESETHQQLKLAYESHKKMGANDTTN